MKQFIVLDIHPKDAHHENSAEEPVRCGDVITVEDDENVVLTPCSVTNLDESSLIGFFSGHLGEYFFFAVKVAQVEQPNIEP